MHDTDHKSLFFPLILLGFILLVIVGLAGYYLGTTQSKPPQKTSFLPSLHPSASLSPIPIQPEENGCSYDAKTCADESIVGRSGPNCEYTPCPEEDLAPPIGLTTAPNPGECVTGGCSGELCVENIVTNKGDQRQTTCQYKEEYTCLKKSVCEKQFNGKCGWTQTPEYTQCLAIVLE